MSLPFPAPNEGLEPTPYSVRSSVAPASGRGSGPGVRRQLRQEPTHTRRKESMTDFAAFKERQQQGWVTGDFGIIARTMVLVGELLCEAVDSALDSRSSTWRQVLGIRRWPPRDAGAKSSASTGPPPSLPAGGNAPPPSGWRSPFVQADPSSYPFPTRLSMRPSPRLVPCMLPTKLRQRASYSGSAAPGGKSA